MNNNIATYLKSGKLLHLITLGELIAGYFLINLLVNWQTAGWLDMAFKIYAILFVGSLPVFAQLDARSRYQNYKQLRDQFILYGYDTRILKPVIKSRCQRDAAHLAAIDTGYGAECKLHFRKAGYRWYHLFPDFVFTHPQFLLTGFFWKTTFFCPTYRSKLNQLDPEVLSIKNNLIPTMIQHG